MLSLLESLMGYAGLDEMDEEEAEAEGATTAILWREYRSIRARAVKGATS